jgi:3-oxoacyl-[acyl-carrier-protein] synthase-3
MTVFITRTGSFLPGEPVENAAIPDYLGSLLGEAKTREIVLRANGIRQRHYALDRRQNATHDVYEMAALAAQSCLDGGALEEPITYLSAGSTHTPLNGPGLASMLHGRLQRLGLVDHALEINSNAGICTSAAQALVNASRAARRSRRRTSTPSSSAPVSPIVQQGDTVNTQQTRHDYECNNSIMSHL